MTDIFKNKKITAQVAVISGEPISIYEWKLDDIIQLNNTDTFTIPPNTLSTGTHTIKFRGQNYCGNWSSELIENINITEVINMAYEQTDPVTVDQPAVSTTIKLRRTAVVSVIVTDEADIPVVSAQVSVAGVPGTTDVLGAVTLSAVPYGAQTVTTTIP